MYCVIAIDKRSLSREAYCISAYKKKSHNGSFSFRVYSCILPSNINIKLQYRAGIEVLLTYLASRWWQQDMEW